MTTYTGSELQTALANFMDNLDNKLDIIINGDSTTTVTVDSGTVPTIAKLMSDMQGSVTASNFVFNGTGSQTSFVCTGANIASVDSVIVAVDGLVIAPADYTLSGVDTVVFGTAPASGTNNVQIRVLGVPSTVSSANANAISYLHPGTGAVSRTQDTYNQDRVSVKDFGATGDGVTDDTTAVQNALVAAAGKTLYFPAGDYLITSDLSISTDYTCIMGEGSGSTITLQACKIHLDAVTKTTHIYGCNFESINIERTSTAGPAIHMAGQNSMGVTRWNMRNVRITSTGAGMQMGGAWGWDMVGCTILGCGTHGIEIVLAADGNSSVNAGKFIGCEIQGNTNWGVYAETTTGLNFLGTTIQGNTSGGVNLQNNCRATSFFGCYFELNGTASTARDILAGDTSFSGTKTTGYSLGVYNSLFFDGSGAAKDYSIELSRMQQAQIIGNYFDSYATNPIYNNPEVGTATSGLAIENGTDSASLVASADSRFNQGWQETVIAGSGAYTFGTVSADSQSTHDFSITGASVGDWVQISISVDLQGLIMTAQVISSGTVRVTMTNTTASDITLGSATFRYIITPYELML